MASQASDDDVWDDGDASPNAEVISDVSRIRRDHFNAGYLEGITSTKDEALQRGFDGGYPVGAEIGLQVGKILGTLQGLGLWDLHRSAAAELSVERLFSGQHWTEQAEAKFTGIHPDITKWETLVASFKSS